MSKIIRVRITGKSYRNEYSDQDIEYYIFEQYKRMNVCYINNMFTFLQISLKDLSSESGIMKHAEFGKRLMHF